MYALSNGLILHIKVLKEFKQIKNFPKQIIKHYEHNHDTVLGCDVPRNQEKNTSVSCFESFIVKSLLYCGKCVAGKTVT